MRQKRLILLGSVLVTVVLSGGAGINSSIHVADGEVREGTLSALNGRISIGDDATVGDCRSVNGSITVGRDSRVESLNSVNGGVSIGEGAIVENGVAAVNGKISLSRGARAEALTTVNGPIRLTGAEVGRDVKTINGNIELHEGSTVHGDIVVEEPDGNSRRQGRPLRIELEDGSVVEGNVIVEDPDMDVELYLRDGSRVIGRVENATVIED